MKTKNRRNKSRKFHRDSSFVSPEIFLKGGQESQTVVVSRLLAKIKQLSSLKEPMSIFSISNNPMLPNSMVPIFSKPESFGAFYNPASYMKSDFYIYWLLGLMIRNARVIRDFNDIRLNFNVCLLRSDYDGALLSLKKADEITFSWWCFESRAHLLKEVSNKSAKKQLQNIEELLPHEGSKKEVQRLLMMSESTSIDFFSEFIRAQLKEYRSSGELDAELLGVGLSYLNLPINLDTERAPDFRAIYFYSSDSIIDQYVLFKELILAIDFSSIDSELKKLILSFANKVNDRQILSSISKVESDADPLVEDVVCLYTEGRYEEVIIKIDEARRNGLQTIYGLFEIYGRAKLYAKSSFEDDLFNKLSKSLMAIANLEPDCMEAISYIKKICLKFRNELWAKLLNFHLNSMLENFAGRQSIELLRNELTCISELATPKARNFDLSSWLEEISYKVRVPEQRRLRYKVGAGGIQYYDRKVFPITSDYLLVQMEGFLRNGEVIRALEFCVDNYIENPLTTLFMPLDTLCNMAFSLDKDNEDKFILSLIVLDIFSIEIDSSYDECKSELFDEFLEFTGTHLPSLIFSKQNLSKRNFYFLKNICIPSELDNIVFFESNDDVIYERIKILDLLISMSPESMDDLKSEKDRVIETLFSSKLRAKIESGKLFVDVQALESRKKLTYLGLFENAKAVLGGQPLEDLEDEQVHSTENIFELNSNSEIPLAVPSNEKTEIVAKIYRQIAKDFAMNEDYGLDKYLSAEIRHFVFVSQLRSCFEKYKLITASENQIYLSNVYWREKYHYINERILNSIDVSFAVFSQRVDSYLKDANNRFKVTSENTRRDEESESSWIFDFSTYYSRVVEVSEIIINADDFDNFFTSLLDFMWEICAEHAREAQRIINDDLKSKIIYELDNLENSINEIKGQAAMFELVQDIRSAKSEFQNQVEVVLNWFKPSGSESSSSNDSLKVVVEATATAFESIYKYKDGSLFIRLSDSMLFLNYREARSLFVALFTALENASRYKKEGSNINLYQEEGELGSLLVVENEIAKGSIHDPDRFVYSQKSKFNDKNASLSRKEGGSGLFKIYNHLKNASDGFYFDLEVGPSVFRSIIGLRHESFTR